MKVNLNSNSNFNQARPQFKALKAINYKNGFDLKDLLKGSWGSPGFLEPHFWNCCFITRAVHIQNIHQLFG